MSVCVSSYVRMRPLAEVDCLRCSSKGANRVITFRCFISCTSLSSGILYFVSICECDVQ